MDEKQILECREAMFRGAWNEARRMAQAWLKEESENAEAHLIAAIAAGEVSGKTFTRKAEFLSHGIQGLKGRDSEGKDRCLDPLISFLDRRFAPYLRVRNGFVFSSKEEAMEYFHALEEQMEILDAFYEAAAEGTKNLRVPILERFGARYHASCGEYYYEEVSVDNNIPVRRKNRVRYGFIRAWKARSMYKKADEAYRSLVNVSREEEELQAAQKRAEEAKKAGLERIAEAEKGTDKLELLRARAEQERLNEEAEAAQAALREYKAGQKKQIHL